MREPVVSMLKAAGTRWPAVAAALTAACGVIAAQASPALAHSRPMPMPMSAQQQLSALSNTQVGSTVPANGDTNPYGMAVVPFSSGKLKAGDVLVANFNNAAGTPGAGTTIVQVDPRTGQTTLFYQGHNTLVGPVGLAINPAKDIVWLGDYGPANAGGVWDGANANVDVISPGGKLLTTFDNQSSSSGIFSGVWGMAVSDIHGHVSFYWPNVGDGTTGTGGGTVWQLNPLSGVGGQPLESSYSLIGGGFGYANTPGTTAATAGGPEGIVYDPHGNRLYVTDDVTNQVIAISGISTGSYDSKVIASGGMLNAPQNITINPANGDLLVVNGAGNNDLLEYTPGGNLVASRDLQPNQAAGALFGMTATVTQGHSFAIYYGDDDTNTLWSLTGMLPAHHRGGPHRHNRPHRGHRRGGRPHGHGRRHHHGWTGPGY
jgi:hypothetical protein